MKKYFKKLYFYLLNNLNPKISNSNNHDIKHYGTFYGGYDIIDNLEIKEVISCGLGEDASFDTEIINKKKCKVYLVDPTPRSLQHYLKIKENFGKPKTQNYSKDGYQSIQAYNLLNINSKNFVLIYKAIFDTNKEKLKLYLPENEDYVSASMNRSQNYSKNFFYAETITIDEIIKKYSLKKIDILKLDIEGAEIKVINDMIRKKIFPKQLIIEYTNISSRNLKQRYLIFKTNRYLIENNYMLVYKNEKGDFTYLYKK